MKKICVSFIILLLILSTQVFAIDEYDLGSTKRFEISQLALTELLERYKTDEVLEKERIIDYRWCGMSGGIADDQGIIKMSINFTVTPYLEENSMWKNDFQYIAFTELSVDNKEYVVEKVFLKPENYDKFLEKFEEYQKNESETVEIQAVSAEKTEELKTNKIEKMSNIIFVSSSIVLGIVVLIMIVNIIKKTKLWNLIAK